MSRDQAKEIYEYVKGHAQADTEDIAIGTGWNRHVVEVALGIMEKEGLVRRIGTSEWGDPEWTAT